MEGTGKQEVVMVILEEEWKKEKKKVLCHKLSRLNEEREVQVFAITRTKEEVLTSDAVP